MGKLNVLVVDDEPGIRSGITRILCNYRVGYPFLEEDFEFNTIEVETGEKAIEVMEAGGIDIALLDNKLPGMNGIEVLEHMSKTGKDIPVMMITSYASLDLAVKATDFGAYNFVPKPFTPQELKSAMENITKHLFLKRMTHKVNEDSQRTRSQFLSVLSHELKSPINAIEGYLKIMQEKQAGESIEDYRVMIERSIERIKGMRMLIRDLLDLTRFEVTRHDRRLEKIDLFEYGRNSLDQMELLAKNRAVQLEFEAQPNSYLDAVPNEISIIFNNLVSNAIKYNRQGGKVFFRIEDLGGEYRITVSDTGIGMNEDEIGRLFQDFVRIKNTKTREIAGSGLGLSITKKYAELYGGRIDVQSQPDSGTTFTVLLKKQVA
jgi:two-component system, sensor histidine kinase and response regulator